MPDPLPSYVAGYRQWQQLGRQVQKGQPGYMIFAPVTGRFASSNPADPSSWRRLGPREKHKVNEVVRSRMVGARPAYVWDVTQTDGDPIPSTPRRRCWKARPRLGCGMVWPAQVEALGFEVLRVPDEGMIGGANGLTDYVARQVSVRDEHGPAAQVKTLAHELAHVLMHDPDDEDARQHRGIREVEAETVALMIGAAHGMDTSGYTIPYVSGWAARVDGQEPAQVVKATGERVRKTALAILDQLDTLQVGDGTPPGLERDTPRAPRPPEAGGFSRAVGGAGACVRCAGAGGAGAVMPDPFDVLAALIAWMARRAWRWRRAASPRRACRCSRACPGGKRPLTRRGFLDATTDAAQVAAWWSRTPNANIGIPTGAASGVVVVDVDVHGPIDGRVAWTRAADAGLVDGAGLLVRTPTGGMHAYFPATPGREQRSWQAAAAGIDFRGDGGYIIAPPSPGSSTAASKRYQVADIAAHSVGPVDAGRLRDFLDPRPAAPARPGGGVGGRGC